jgi:lipopolysaccharide export system protein LptA
MSGPKRRSRPAAAPGRSNPAVPAISFLALALLLASPLPAETFTYSGDSMSTSLAEGSERALLKGNARVDTEDMRITADEIDLFGKDFIYAQCRGSVRVVDAKRGIELSSRELFYNRKEKIARIKGNAMMTDLKNEIVVKGGFIEDRDTEKLTIVQIGVRILKKDLVCRSEFAKYWRDRKVLELSGMPFVTRKGDEYQATRIVVDLDTEQMTFQGDVKGSLQSGDKETGTDQNPATDQNAGAGEPAATGEPAGTGRKTEGGAGGR